jgi:sugar phosphate permease
MYLVLGLISFVVGLWCLFFMPDTPMECKFLTKAEKTAILHHVSVNKTGIVNRKIEWHQLRELAIDPQIWLIAGGTVIISLGSGILGTYASTLIKNFGYTSKQASLLNMPGGAIAIVSTLGFGWIIRHHYLTRWAASIIGYGLALVGAGLVAFAPHHNKAAQLVGIWMVSFSIFTSSIKFSWIAANVAGHTKRSAATALVSGAVSVGNIMAPYAVQPKDAPRYQTGRLVLFGSKATAICILTLLFFYYKFANKQRDRRYGAVRSDSMARGLGIEEEVTAEEASETWANVTDMEKKTFRYVL